MSMEKSRDMEFDEEIKPVDVLEERKESEVDSVKLAEVEKVEREDKENLNLRAAIIHMVGDMV